MRRTKDVPTPGAGLLVMPQRRMFSENSEEADSHAEEGIERFESGSSLWYTREN